MKPSSIIIWVMMTDRIWHAEFDSDEFVGHRIPFNSNNNNYNCNTRTKKHHPHRIMMIIRNSIMNPSRMVNIMDVLRHSPMLASTSSHVSAVSDNHNHNNYYYYHYIFATIINKRKHTKVRNNIPWWCPPLGTKCACKQKKHNKALHLSPRRSI